MDGGQNARPVMAALPGLGALAATLTVAGEVYAQVGPPPARAQAMAEATLVAPTPVARLAPGDAPVAVRGRVAERFGGDFILDDGTGRALVETGPRGEEVAPVALSMTVTAQGRFAHGVLRAMLIADAAGKVTPLAPPGAFGRGRRGGPPPCGPGGDAGGMVPPPPAG